MITWMQSRKTVTNMKFVATAGLKAFIENHKSQLSHEEFEKLKWDIDVAMDFFMQDLMQFAPGSPRGRRVHELLENEIEKASSIAVSCKKGCGACCHFEVEVTHDDAEVLKSVMLAKAAINLIRLESLAKRERQGAEWKKGVVPANR